MVSDWKLYVAIYFGIGFLACISFVTAHLIAKREESSFVQDAIKALNPRREDFWYRFLEDFLIPVLAFFLIWLVWPVAIGIQFKERIFKKATPAKATRRVEIKEFVINDDELIRQVSPEEVERTNFIHDPMEAVPNVPFGHCNARWVKLRDSIQANETLWEFESSRAELKGVGLMWGYAVKANGPVDRFMTTGWKIKIDEF